MNADATLARVVAVAADAAHRFSKPLRPSIRLREGLGVDDDAHQGVTVRHRSRVAADPTQPNLRQVHLLHAELFEELAGKGFDIAPGDLGENIVTRGLDLLGLPRGARLRIGDQAVVEITGLRNPCQQIDRFRPGLLAAVLDRAPDGRVIRKAGIMGVVVAGGAVCAGDAIEVRWPAPPFHPLERV
jgi:MOSC domain-containing protein YiiM